MGPAEALLGCRVLLAEDSADNQRLIRAILEKAGATVAVAGDGQAALEEAKDCWSRGEAPDVILTDIQMPVLNGYELVERLRAAGYTGRIIALTANAATGDREKCLAAGCDDYLSKPIDRNLLLSAVRRRLEA
jgi:CheY-like chemotaxis protein